MKSLTRKQAEALGIPWTGDAPSSIKTDGLTGRDKLFDAQCAAHGLPLPVHEYPWGWEAPPHPRTGKPRTWRFDYLFAGVVAVERIGGVWGVGPKCKVCGRRQMGEHSKGQTQIDDMERRNEAQMLGYILLEFVPDQFDDGSAFAVIRRALEGDLT